jgi:prepilin-type processing-associated H-X9-DG protein
MRLARVHFTVWHLIAVALLTAASCLVLIMVARARRENAKSECLNHLRQLSITIVQYSTSRGRFPPGAVPNETLPVEKRLSWILDSLPFLEGNAPAILDPSKAWDDEVNRSMWRYNKDTGQRVSQGERDDFAVFRCPSNPRHIDSAGHGLTHFVGVAGLGTDAPLLAPLHPRAGLFGYRPGTRNDQLTDGFSTTLAIIETASANGPWKAGGFSTIRGLDPHAQPYIGQGRQFGGLHRGGVNVAFADGSVRFVRETINPKVFEALSTVAGGERLPAGAGIDSSVRER